MLNQWKGARGLRQTNTHGGGFHKLLLLYKVCKYLRVERSQCHVMSIIYYTGVKKGNK